MDLYLNQINMDKKLNGFNNGRDTTDGVGGKPGPGDTSSISTVTTCPTCGSEVTVGGEGTTHYYIPNSEKAIKDIQDLHDNHAYFQGDNWIVLKRIFKHLK